jgi:predicted glycogen debranching enzyme
LFDELKNQEWLEADGLGGFAMGTPSGVRTRRYHALLQVATAPPTGRMTLVNGFDAWIETPSGRHAISSQRYGADVTFPNGIEHLESFDGKTWPTWIYKLPDGTRLQQEIFVPKGSPAVAIAWTLLSSADALVTLQVRPFLSGRDCHATHHENDGFRFKSVKMDSRILWQPYPGVPAVGAISNASYMHDPRWYRNFFYERENERGLDAVEDLASPGEFTWNLSQKKAVLIFNAEGVDGNTLPDSNSPLSMLTSLKKSERTRRDKLISPLHALADACIVKRGTGKTIIAGYPWFTDWGRDTFIALRGLCLATQRLADAKLILLEWAGAVTEGMLPNVFPDGATTPAYNSIDASLWYVIAVYDFLKTADIRSHPVSKQQRKILTDAIQTILTGYKNGTRFGIRMDSDGLIQGGAPGVALTWMDARVDGVPVTPRHGKPVEVQALWLNALNIGSQFSPAWTPLFKRGQQSFSEKFWNEEKGFLNDVVDADFREGAVDASLRPNQIFAVGGLPYSLLAGERARRVVDVMEKTLLTPAGLRTLAPGEDGYAPQYAGDVPARARAYHQGTAWPWLMGAFVEAWLNIRQRTPKALKEARQKFSVLPVCEIADAQAPFTSRGCPFQAWSIGEALRLREDILKENSQ